MSKKCVVCSALVAKRCKIVVFNQSIEKATKIRKGKKSRLVAEMGEKVFFLSGRDRCAQVYQHECKIYKHVCKTDRGAAVQKSAKICKNLQNLQNLQNMQSALTNSKRGAYTTTCPHLSLALTSS